MQIKHTYIFFILLLSTLYTTNSYALACGDAVTSDITLTENLNCTSGYRALEVFANNVTIDLNGYTISGSSSLAGIYIVGYKNVTVKNGSIKDFWVAINSTNTTGLTVNNMTFYEVGAGVIISQGNNAHIHSNDFIRTSSHGVSIANRNAKSTANGNIVNNNEFYQAQLGIAICGDQADANTITNNLLWKTIDFAIHLNSSDHNVVRNNRVLESNSTALRLNNSSYNQIESNSFREGDHSGISILAKAGDACLLGGSTLSYKNIVRSNHSIGFETGVILGLGASKSANVFDNTVIGNKLYDNNLGLFFNRDAHNNDGAGNAYQGTITDIEDEGVGNLY
ncbi:MAG: parallel beta-helix repeat protein [Arenicella sp.]|jgi:parallel beta-helix repeat protein